MIPQKATITNKPIRPWMIFPRAPFFASSSVDTVNWITPQIKYTTARVIKIGIIVARIWFTTVRILIAFAANANIGKDPSTALKATIFFINDFKLKIK
jgi:hypothetical protein